MEGKKRPGGAEKARLKKRKKMEEEAAKCAKLTSLFSRGQTPAAAERRVVVFGGKFSGKTSLINALFGKELPQNEKRTAHCQKHQENVCGRELTLVDTPGWWKDFPLSDTATFLKQELIQGVSLVNPGPHAIILVIQIDIPFEEKHRKAAEDHLGLFGGQIWTYAFVVFTRSHSLREKTVEEHLKKEGKVLQWLIEKCGNRYCEFDSRVPNNTSQVKQMLEMIDNIVQSNSSGYFQIDSKILEEAAEWKKTVMTKAKSRELKIQEQRRELHKDELRIALLGWVIAGKSSAGNIILNKQVFVTGQSTVNCSTAHGVVDGRPVTVLDTPSWFKYFPSQYTPSRIKSEILKNQILTSPHCILLVIPGDTSFKEEQKKVIEGNMSFLGEQVWRHTIVLFTWGDILGDLTIEEHIESEGEALQWVIHKCENRYHVFNNEERENRAQVTELFQKIDEMMTRNSFFQPSTEMFGRITAQEEVNTQSKASSDDSDLQNIQRYLDEEWRRRDKKLLERVTKVEEDMKARLLKSDRSLEFPPNFSGTTLNTKLEDSIEKQEPETDPESCNLNEKKQPLEIKEIKDMFDREWSRREETLMGRVLEMLSELRCDAHSEPTEHDKEKSKLKVTDWLQNQYLGYNSASGSNQSDT